MASYWPLIRKQQRMLVEFKIGNLTEIKTLHIRGNEQEFLHYMVQETWNSDYVITIAFATLNMVWVIQRMLHKCFSAAEWVSEKQRTALNSAFELGFCDWLDENRKIKCCIWEFTRVWQNQKGGATWRLESQNSDYVGGNNQVLGCR